MRTRLIAVGLVAGAALLDVAGFHGPAYFLLVAAVPVSAAAALLALGDLLASPTRTAALRLRPPLGALVLVLVLAAAASRAPFVPAGEVPAMAGLALAGCLVALALDALVAGLGRLTPRAAAARS